MKKNVAFVSNFDLTYFFHEIAQNLIKYNIDVFWFVVNRKYYKFLLKYYKKSNILLINKKYAEKNENVIGDYKLNELIFGDRELKYNHHEGYNFLSNIQAPIYNFIKNNSIKYIFGELTWAHEILIQRIVEDKKELNCKYLMPHTIRIPSHRFAFFEDEFQSKIYEINKACIIGNEDQIKKYSNAQEIKIEKPYYLKVNDELKKKENTILWRVHKLINFVTNRNIDPLDPTVGGGTRFSRLKRNVGYEFNKISYKFLTKITLSYLNKKKFVFYPLHKQPEASIDIIGRYYEDQLQNIINIWRILPNDWYLVVKEHTNALGDRGIKFFNNILKLRNVLLIEETVDSHKIIEKSEAVFTVSGTAAYEAALLNKKAFTFSPVFFTKLKNVTYITLENLKYFRNFLQLFHYQKKDNKKKLDKKEFKIYLYKNSFEGIIYDPIKFRFESNFVKNNFKKIFFAFKKIISCE